MVMSVSSWSSSCVYVVPIFPNWSLCSPSTLIVIPLPSNTEGVLSSPMCIRLSICLSANPSFRLYTHVLRTINHHLFELVAPPPPPPPHHHHHHHHHTQIVWNFRLSWVPLILNFEVVCKPVGFIRNVRTNCVSYACLRFILNHHYCFAIAGHSLCDALVSRVLH